MDLLDIVNTIWVRLEALKEAGCDEVKIDLVLAIIELGLNGTTDR